MIVIAIVFHTYNNNTSRRNNFQWIMVSAFDILWYKRRLKNLGKMSKRNDSSNQFNENCYTNSHKTNWLLQHSTGHFCSTTLLYPWSKKYVKLLPLYFTSVMLKHSKMNKEYQIWFIQLQQFIFMVIHLKAQDKYRKFVFVSVLILIQV